MPSESTPANTFEKKVASMSQFPSPQIWRSKAACLGVDPELFYPDPDNEDAANPAKLICGACPVQESCLEFAFRSGEKEGIWGGCTERERRRIIRQRRRSA